jgi:hypothetical protein
VQKIDIGGGHAQSECYRFNIIMRYNVSIVTFFSAGP